MARARPLQSEAVAALVAGYWSYGWRGLVLALTYLGGVFYSIDLLPEFWRMVSLLNPVVYMVNVFLYGLLGVSDVNVFASLLAIVLFTGGLFFWALWLLKRGVGIRH